MACTARSRQCDTAYVKRGLPTPDCCRDLVISTFAAAVRLLEEADVRYWLDYGALLGAVREGGMIPWDNDADISILLEDWGKLKRLRAAAEDAGVALRFIKHLDYARFQVSFANRLHVCVFVWHEVRPGWLERPSYMRVDDLHGKGRGFPKAWVEERTRVSWEGIPAWAPADPVRMVEHRYGPDWRRPAKHRMERRAA